MQRFERSDHLPVCWCASTDRRDLLIRRASPFFRSAWPELLPLTSGFSAIVPTRLRHPETELDDPNADRRLQVSLYACHSFLLSRARRLVVRGERSATSNSREKDGVDGLARAAAAPPLSGAAGAGGGQRATRRLG